MKKLMIVLAVGMIASNGMAQSGKKTPPPPPAPPTIEAPVPPPPPPAALQDVQFAPPKIVKDAPPPPPAPPKPPTITRVRFAPPVIVNDKGYAMLIKQTKEEPIIILTKNGVTQKIRMSVWNAKPEYFENKYGKLPPPPPPAPPVKE